MLSSVLGNEESGEGGQNSLPAAAQVDHQQLSASKIKINQGRVLIYNITPFFFCQLAGRLLHPAK